MKECGGRIERECKLAQDADGVELGQNFTVFDVDTVDTLRKPAGVEGKVKGAGR